MDLSQEDKEFAENLPKFCQPHSYCSYNPATQSCGCKPGSGCKEDSVCGWALKDIDCPIDGCFGFSVKMPDNFVATKQPLPAPIRFKSDPYFEPGTVRFDNAIKPIAGSCYYPNPPTQPIEP